MSQIHHALHFILLIKEYHQSLRYRTYLCIVFICPVNEKQYNKM